MEYYSALKRDEIVPPTETWMDTETVRQSVVSQKEKNKYHTYNSVNFIYYTVYYTQYSCLENLWTEEPRRLQSMGSQRVGYD